jgi:hypothetical protein
MYLLRQQSSANSDDVVLTKKALNWEEKTENPGQIIIKKEETHTKNDKENEMTIEVITWTPMHNAHTCAVYTIIHVGMRIYQKKTHRHKRSLIDSVYLWLSLDFLRIFSSRAMRQTPTSMCIITTVQCTSARQGAGKVLLINYSTACYSYLWTYDLYGPVVMLLMRATPLRGQVG